MNLAYYPELAEPETRRWIVVSFWGTETCRTFFDSRLEALEHGNREAGQGADVHVARVIAQQESQ